MPETIGHPTTTPSGIQPPKSAASRASKGFQNP
jgi:hypothetical protein